jgi:hypothetical protein
LADCRATNCAFIDGVCQSECVDTTTTAYYSFSGTSQALQSSSLENCISLCLNADFQCSHYTYQVFDSFAYCIIGANPDVIDPFPGSTTGNFLSKRTQEKKKFLDHIYSGMFSLFLFCNQLWLLSLISSVLFCFLFSESDNWGEKKLKLANFVYFRKRFLVFFSFFPSTSFGSWLTVKENLLVLKFNFWLQRLCI